LVWPDAPARIIPGVMAPPSANDTNDVPPARLHVGDTIVISFDGLPDALPSQDKTINEDGNITLSDIGSVKAAGKPRANWRTSSMTSTFPDFTPISPSP